MFTFNLKHILFYKKNVRDSNKLSQKIFQIFMCLRLIDNFFNKNMRLICVHIYQQIEKYHMSITSFCTIFKKYY